MVDVWDALCTDRPYRSAMPIEQVRAYLIAEADKQFDPRIVVAFLRLDEGRLS